MGYEAAVLVEVRFSRPAAVLAEAHRDFDRRGRRDLGVELESTEGRGSPSGPEATWQLLPVGPLHVGLL